MMDKYIIVYKDGNGQWQVEPCDSVESYDRADELNGEIYVLGYLYNSEQGETKALERKLERIMDIINDEEENV